VAVDRAPDGVLIGEIRTRLETVADPDRAPQMQAYMKSAMPYLGVRVPEVRRLTHAASRSRPFTELGVLVATVRMLWDDARYREHRYAATALCDTDSAQRLRSPMLLPLYRDLIVAGAWWDHVDELAHRVGELLAGWPTQIRPELCRWIVADDRWLRRTAIIAQLGRKRETDVSLLAKAIDANAGERDFFLRKAIGWALREYARTDPEWVRGFVAARELSPLSRREALKHL
jgi:3-methyladenine DNA glycosylase AlkD